MRESEGHRSFIKKRWPLWGRLLLAPLALLGAILSLPVLIILIFADFDRASAIMDFWTEPT